MIKKAEIIKLIKFETIKCEDNFQLANVYLQVQFSIMSSRIQLISVFGKSFIMFFFVYIENVRINFCANTNIDSNHRRKIRKKY